MNNLLVNKLYIFSIPDKKARVFDFSKGINVITSSGKDGNKVGKSIILKSIYHTLGADCFFDGKWDSENKVYIIEISIRGESYQIYRYDKLFKIFHNYILKYITESRHELGEYYSDIFNFAVQLPNRLEDKLEITPPAYFFALNFIDQDKMDGPSFDSFSNLTQYKKYKENLLYSHFDVFNEKYYSLIKTQEKLKEDQTNVQNNLAMLSSFVEKIKTDILDVDFSSSLEALNKELDFHKSKYADIIKKLSKIKEQLIRYRNEKEKLSLELENLNDSKNSITKDIGKIKKHVCPVCESELSDNTIIRAKKYNSLEDIILLSNDLEMELKKIDRHIEQEKEKYQEQLQVLNSYQDKLGTNKTEIKEIVKQQGAIEIRDKMFNELGIVQANLKSIDTELKAIGKALKQYSDTKKSINQKYYKLMISDKVKFNLKEIKNENLENISKTYKAQGSNRNIATIIWYYNLLKIKAEYNPDSIRFPVVVDSPTDVELDNEKKHVFWDYIFTNICEHTQLIVSTLGFDVDKYKKYVDSIITISTPKYSLLTNEDYEKYKHFLLRLNDNDKGKMLPAAD